MPLFGRTCAILPQEPLDEGLNLFPGIEAWIEAGAHATQDGDGAAQVDEVLRHLKRHGQQQITELPGHIGHLVKGQVGQLVHVQAPHFVEDGAGRRLQARGVSARHEHAELLVTLHHGARILRDDGDERIAQPFDNVGRDMRPVMPKSTKIR